MAVTSYSTLKTAVSTWVERSSDTTYTGEVDTFIDLAEAKFSRALVGHHRMEEASTLTTDANGEATLPSDYLGFKSAIWDGTPDKPLRMVSWERLQVLNPFNTSGVPSYCAIRGTTIKVAPIKAGDIFLSYYETIPALSDSNTTNWLLTAAPDAYLFMSIAMGHAFNEDEVRAVAWEAKAMGIISEVLGVGTLGVYGNTGITLDFAAP